MVGSILNDTECDSRTKPAIGEDCMGTDCKYSWLLSEWSRVWIHGNMNARKWGRVWIHGNGAGYGYMGMGQGMRRGGNIVYPTDHLGTTSYKFMSTLEVSNEYI